MAYRPWRNGELSYVWSWERREGQGSQWAEVEIPIYSSFMFTILVTNLYLPPICSTCYIHIYFWNSSFKMSIFGYLLKIDSFLLLYQPNYFRTKLILLYTSWRFVLPQLLMTGHQDSLECGFHAVCLVKCPLTAASGLVGRTPILALQSVWPSPWSLSPSLTRELHKGRDCSRNLCLHSMIKGEALDSHMLTK